MSESRACAHPGCAGSARKGSDYCCNAHKQAAYRKRNKQPVTGTAVTLESVTDENEGTIGTSDKRSSSTGDPRDTESGECVDLSDPLPGMGGMTVGDMALPADVMVESCGDPPGDRVFVEGEPGYRQTIQCYRDSGIPLPGDLGYRGVCALHHESKRWLLHPNRLRLTRAEMQKRHAHV